MRHQDLAVLDHLTLPELELNLDQHTRQRIPVDRWTSFSWSVTRHDRFQRCRRLYYLHYYGARRVREARSPVVSAIWWLKQVTTLDAWIGTVIHQTAAEAIRAHQQGRPVRAADLEIMSVENFRAGVVASERGAKHNNQWVILLEHLYPRDSMAINLEDAEQRVIARTQSLASSEAYQMILSLPPTAIREIDPPFQSFMLEEVPRVGMLQVYVIPDVLMISGSQAVIVDWKTGDAERASIAHQAGTYRLYAHLQYGIAEADIDVIIADLQNQGRAVVPRGGLPSLEEARAFIIDSAAAMVEQMDYLEYNTVAIQRFPMTDDRQQCCLCSFQRACWRHEP